MIWDLKKYGDAPALLDGVSVTTYAQLDELRRAAAEPIPARSLVFILCTNTVGSVAGYIGMVNAGHVPLLLDSKISADLLDNLVKTYRPSYLWLPEALSADFPSAVRTGGAAGYALLDMRESSPYALSPELCVLISTSGSTGSPKLVRQSEKNIVSNTRSIIGYLGITSSERAVTSLPMNYVYGLSVINTHLYAGASVVLTETLPYSVNFWKLVNDNGVTSFAGVPFTYEMVKKLRIMKTDMPTVKTMTQAGGKLPVELQNEFAVSCAEKGIRFVVMYGASEATARMGYLPAEKTLEKQGSMGVAIPGGRFELIDSDGSAITEPDKVGELVYYGDNVTLGYSVAGDDLAKGDENHGRLVTGDMAYRDGDGFYYIVGRKKRFLKILGKRFNLDETERLLQTRFDTPDIACAGKDDELGIFITCEELQKGIEDYLLEELGLSRKLLRFSVVAEIPKNSSGKTQYKELENM
ncbi:MAG: AMP-binding protein [Clostridia bacterium]|nr:AMP-binding protein [Clostridia bacterium]